MPPIARRVLSLHNTVFGTLERLTNGWFLGLFARFIFAAVLWAYFLNSAFTKVGEGFLGFFMIAPGAYYQIALPAVEAAGGDIDQVALFPWGLIVTLGTYAEFILPLLVVAGLFTRMAALGMMVFIAVQTLVDIMVHMVEPETVGALFDRFPDALILDQRLLWLMPLAYLTLKGAGLVSIDGLLASRLPLRTSAHPQTA
ncbi:DoxX family membrane protein [Pseudohoeflea suaedae]|uniref:DoxX family membrane protein n=1 Tax=Pseudohoeflea suaedae TaxID=877384 RepID=A0A4R5PIK6_9HYPH|nr:DoxX family membrane protein [Pseudohoeflea suaedae]TDH35073.1 DoxX family membrane protein [Pseudohoeflea suaedae]